KDLTRSPRGARKKSEASRRPTTHLVDGQGPDAKSKGSKGPKVFCWKTSISPLKSLDPPIISFYLISPERDALSAISFDLTIFSTFNSTREEHMARNAWVKSSKGDRVLYSSIASINHNAGKVYIKDINNNFLLTIYTDTPEEEMKLLNDQMDMIENGAPMPAKKTA
ncbi:hypothetical protein, partial [Azospirillum doebereinerae]